MKYFLYVLESLVKKRYYIGCTTDPKRRLLEHNNGITKSTKPYRPWKLIYLEEFSQKDQAYKKEWYLKHPKGYQEKLKIIAKYGEVPEWPNGAHC